MEIKERYGRFVLQSEDARTSAGSFFRAAQLNEKGYERHVHLFRSELLAPDVAQSVAEGLNRGLQVHHAQVVRGLEAGRIDKTAFAAYELLEGRSAGALMERSQLEGHPFAADHALLIVSKAAAALEAGQAKKQIHGFLIPEFIHVSHDGEVSVRAFGLPPKTLRDSNCVGVREARFLAPETESAGPLDVRADIFSLGAQLFEMLTGTPLSRTETTSKSIEAARIPSPGSDGSPIPKALVTLLAQSIAEDPAKRFKDATAFKKAVDTLLFSGDYSPTTFNLAFFMHTLFRDEGDSDSAIIKAERASDYRTYLSAPPAPVSTPSLFESRTPPTPSPVVSPSGLTHAPVVPVPPPSRASGEFPKPDLAKPETGRSGRVTVPPSASAPVHDTLFQTVSAEKKSFPIVPAIVVALIIGGVAYSFIANPKAPPATAPTVQPTMNPAELAALARVKELESRLAALEAEKLAAEQKAVDEAKKIVEAQAKAKGQSVDPAALQRAQDDARRKAQADQESRLQAERQKIEEEKRRAEETRAAEAAKAAADAAKAAETTPTPAATPTLPPFVPAQPLGTAATQTPTPAPSVAPTPAGSAPSPAATGPAVLDLGDPTVIAPQLLSQPKMEYPAVARVQRITGTVVISALIDELGNVVETRVIRGASPNSGLNQAALDSVKRRKYRPATQNGKAGRAWVAIQIDFKL